MAGARPPLLRWGETGVAMAVMATPQRNKIVINPY